jgi:hypothetical protein
MRTLQILAITTLIAVGISGRADTPDAKAPTSSIPSKTIRLHATIFPKSYFASQMKDGTIKKSPNLLSCPAPTHDCTCGLFTKCCNSNETCVCQNGNLPICAH